MTDNSFFMKTVHHYNYKQN